MHARAMCPDGRTYPATMQGSHASLSARLCEPGRFVCVVILIEFCAQISHNRWLFCIIPHRPSCPQLRGDKLKQRIDFMRAFISIGTPGLNGRIVATLRSHPNRNGKPRSNVKEHNHRAFSTSRSRQSMRRATCCQEDARVSPNRSHNSAR